MLRNLMSMSMMRVVSALLTLSLLASVSRVWGLVPLGQFSLLLTLFMFFQLLPLLGLNMYLIREVAAEPDSAARHTPNAALFAVVCAVALMVLLGAGGGWLYRDQPTLAVPLWLVAVSLLPTAPIVVSESILLAQQRMHVVARVNVVESLVRTTASLAIVHLGGGLDAVFFAFLLCRIGAAIAYAYRADLPTMLHAPAISRTVQHGYLRALPSFLGIALCAALVNRLDVLFLSRLGTAQQLGLYAVPSKFYELGQMVPQILMVVLYPRLVAMHQQRPDAVPGMVAGTVALPLLVMVPFVVLLGWHAAAVLSFFGPQSAAAAPVLGWLLLALAAVGTNQMLACCMLMRQRPDLDLRTLAAASVLSAAALVYTVPRLGAVGAAMVVAAIAFASVLLRLLLLRRLVAIGPVLRALADLCLPTGAMLGCLALVQGVHPVAVTALALLAYAAVAAAVLRAHWPAWRRMWALVIEARDALPPPPRQREAASAAA